MNNNYLLTLASSVIPISAIAFVVVLLIFKIYIKIRSKFNTTVNCWFCNQNARVPYLESNSWTCPHCEQYNGFTKEGDYNREIFQQRDCSNLSAGAEYSDHSSEFYMRTSLPPRNGFCDGCNEAQRLKVEKLAQFEPKNESHFDAELKAHKQQLEEQYRLCSTCDRHLNKVLREKKKMVLGSKFLAYIIKGAETLKQPHFNQIRFARQQHWKQRLTLWTTLLIGVNICCLLSVLPALTSNSFINVFGASLGSQMFFAFSHILAFGKVIYAYLEKASAHPNIIKMCLFLRTLMLMLLYSLGLKWPQIGNLNLSNLYMLACPFAMLSLAFAYNVVDSFKLTRFTFLLAVWSAFAGGIVNEDLIISKDFALLLASCVTLMLSATCKNKILAKLHDNTANSFHKIFSEDYLSDEDTLSMLSQHLNSSSTSVRSLASNRSYQATSPLNSHLSKSPITSSVLSLNNLPTHAQLSPTSSFKSFCIDDNQTLRPQYAASMCNYPMGARPRSPIFASHQELNYRDRQRSSAFGLTANVFNNSAHNATISNASFLEPNVFSLKSQQKHQADRFFTPNTYPVGGRSTFVVNHAADVSLASPFSVSSNAVHQQRLNNVLTPSRFSTTCLASNTSAASWLSGGYFNQPNQTDTTKRGQYLLEHRNVLTTIDENLSRASSQSSGFESQNGRLNLSRENSFCPDSVDLMQRTVCLDNAKGFQPIESTYSGGGGNSAFSPRPSLLSQKNNNFSQPLTVNCSTAASVEHAKNDMWPRTSAPRKSNGLGGGRDSFNLRKINEDLPTIRRGDLLKKWKQGQQQTSS